MKSNQFDQLLGSWANSVALSPAEAAAVRNRIVATAPSRQPLSASWWMECFRLPDSVFRAGDLRGMLGVTG